MIRDAEAIEAAETLRGGGSVPPERGALLLRIARGDLLSVEIELRAALYVGVLLVTAGAGLLVKQNLERIGPTAVAVGIGLGALGAFAWVVRYARPFSWGEVPSPNLAFEYMLLLAALLAAADLAYIEVKFTPLGPAWPWHLLLVAAAYTLLAVRYDSRVLFSLALTTFAAWRGVSVSFASPFDPLTGSARGFGSEPWVLNAAGCGVACVALGAILPRAARKAHFEPVATWVGWLLILGGFASGMIGGSSHWFVYAALLLVSGALLVTLAFRTDRYGLFVAGVIGAYIGLCGLVLEAMDELHMDDAVPVLLWFLLSAGAVLVVLLKGRRWIGSRA